LLLSTIDRRSQELNETTELRVRSLIDAYAHGQLAQALKPVKVTYHYVLPIMLQEEPTVDIESASSYRPSKQSVWSQFSVLTRRIASNTVHGKALVISELLQVSLLCSCPF
jgi:hypothetical protein